jgi:hypothetical protein
MCKECNSKPVYVFSNGRQICKNCFINWFQKKVLYTIRKFSLVKKGDVIGYKKTNNFRDLVLEDLLIYYQTRAPINIVKLPNNKANKIALSDTTDHISQIVIKNLLNKKIRSTQELPILERIIRPLYLFLDQEVLLYAKLNNLKFKQEKENSDKIKKLFIDLEKKHKEVKNAVLNSYLNLSKSKNFY